MCTLMKQKALSQPQEDNDDHVDEEPVPQPSFHSEILDRSMEVINITATYSTYITNM